MFMRCAKLDKKFVIHTAKAENFCQYIVARGQNFVTGHFDVIVLQELYRCSNILSKHSKTSFLQNIMNIFHVARVQEHR